MAVVENYDRPCFFIQLQPINISPINFNMILKNYVIYITYLQKNIDEKDMLDTFDKMQSLFGLSIRINDRYVDVEETEYEFIGTEKNIMKISISIQWMDRIERKYDAPIIESVFFDEKMEE